MTDQTNENADVQAAIDAIAETGRKNAVESQPIKPLGGTRISQSFAIPGDVGTTSVARALGDQLTKTRSAIQGLTAEIDRATAEMTRLWSECERNRELLADLRRSEAMIGAAIHEGNRPAFQRGN